MGFWLCAGRGINTKSVSQKLYTLQTSRDVLCAPTVTRTSEFNKSPNQMKLWTCAFSVVQWRSIEYRSYAAYNERWYGDYERLEGRLRYESKRSCLCLFVKQCWIRNRHHVVVKKGNRCWQQYQRGSQLSCRDPNRVPQKGTQSSVRVNKFSADNYRNKDTQLLRLSVPYRDM